MRSLLIACLICTFVRYTWGDCKFVVLAPNVLHYGVEENVGVILQGDTDKGVTLGLIDYYSQNKVMSNETKNVSRVATFKMTVDPKLIASTTDKYKLQQNHYVILEADCEGTKERTTILLSDKEGTVFIQTDKPIYTPSQTVNIHVYTTDFYNKPVKVSYISLDIVAPSGTIVERRILNSSIIDDPSIWAYNENVIGLLRHKFEIAKKPLTGKWKAVVRHGMFASQKSEVEFEVDEYVLPTFFCKVSVDNQYVILDDDTMSISGEVHSNTTFGKNVHGNVLFRFGVTRNNKKDITYYISKREQLYKGMATFAMSLKDIYDEVGEGYKSSLQDERLVVEATCFDQASSENMKDSNQQVTFVDAPYEFNFMRTKKYFKPGLHLVFQIQLVHKNGNPATNVPIKLNAFAIIGSSRPPLDTSTASTGSIERTNDYGFADHVYSTVSSATKVEIEMEVSYKVGESTKKLNHTYTLESSPAVHDIAIKTQLYNKLVNGKAAITVDIHMKDIGDALLAWAILSKGQIVRVDSSTLVIDTNRNYVPQQIELNQKMVPSARLLVFFIMNNEIGGDSLWIDLEDECQKTIKVEAQNEEDNRYMWKKHNMAELKFVANQNSSLIVQMVDHAVLALNDRLTLTKEKMFSGLETLDLGCFGGGDGSAAALFKMAGLSVVTPFNANTNPSAKIETSVRQDEMCSGISRSKREVDKIVPDTDLCCEYANDTTISDCKDGLRKLLSNAGHIITTDCALSFQECCKQYHHEETEDSEPWDASRSSTGYTKEILDFESNHGVRRDFPESKILDIVKTNDKGVGKLEFLLPDTITTWSLETVELNKEYGMCVAKPFNIVVWKNAFLKIRLPHHAIKGEQLNAEATMYNYNVIGFSDIKFYMKGVEGLCSEARPNKYTEAKYRDLPTNKAVSVSWPIVPMKVGDYKITFLAVHLRKAMDVVEHTLTVHHDGLEKEDSKPFLLAPESDDNPDICRRGSGKLVCSIEVKPKAQHIPGSSSASLSITGNMIGPVVDIIERGLNKYIRIPCGCGEQTMSIFGPNVYFYSYMLKTDTLPGNLEATMEDDITYGVNRMLTFQTYKNWKEVGGIARWTGHQPYPSLTAYVLQVFSMAKRMTPRIVDEYWINGTRRYLFSIQITSGSEKGSFKKWKHRDDWADHIDAFDVIIPLLESDRIDPMENATWSKQLKDSINYMERKFTNTGCQTNLECSKLAYALSLTESSLRSSAYTHLQSQALNEVVDGVPVRYFNYSREDYSYNKRWRKHKGRAVVTASYAILAALEHEDFDFCTNIVRWLHIEKENSGMFGSTRDSALAFQALAAYSTAIQTGQTDLEIRVVKNMDDPEKDFAITEDDKNREFIYNMNSDAVDKGSYVLTLEASGRGNVSVVVNTKYNVDGENICDFTLTVRRSKETLPMATDDTSEDDDDTSEDYDMPDDFDDDTEIVHDKHRLHLEIAVTSNDEDTTDMAMIEVDLLSGYVAEKDSLEKLKREHGDVDEYEINGRTVAIYLTKIYNDSTTVVNFSAVQQDHIENISPAKVVVYDYYERDTRCSTFYTDCRNGSCPTLTESLSSDWKLNVQNDICYEDECSACYGVGLGTGWDAPYNYNKFKQKTCSPDVSYVFQAKYINTTQKSDNSAWTYIYMEVTNVMKKGGNDVKKETVIRFAKQRTCPCPKIEDIVEKRGFLTTKDGPKSARFLIMGRKEGIQPTGGNSAINEYVVDKDVYVQQWKRGRNGPHVKLIGYLKGSKGKKPGCRV